MSSPADEFGSDVDPDFIADYFESTLDGIRVAAKRARA